MVRFDCHPEASVLSAAKDLGEAREASRSLLRNNRAFGSRPNLHHWQETKLLNFDSLVQINQTLLSFHFRDKPAAHNPHLHESRIRTLGALTLEHPSGHRQQTTIGRRDIVNGNTLQQTITANTQPMRRKADAVQRSNRLKSVLRLLGPGLITGAANDDPSAIGTYAKAGAAFGFSTLWIAPVVFPMMAASMFLCSKLGMVSGMGIAGVLRRYYSHRLLYPVVICLVIANIIEAAADLSAIAASIRLIIPVPLTAIILGVTGLILGLQTWGSYSLLQKIFKWLALALLSYVGAAFLAKPDLAEVVRGHSSLIFVLIAATSRCWLRL